MLRIYKQTDRQTDGLERPIPTDEVGVDKKSL